MKIFLAALAATVASATAAVTVPNGDFSAGNSGFTSDYVYGPAAGELLSGPPNSGAGYYAVVANAQFSHPLFTSYGDHTTGSGLYLVANGSNVADTTVYRSATIAITAGTSYAFGAFLSNAYPASPAAIDYLVSLDGGAATSLGSYTIPAGSGAWNGNAFEFNSGTATSVVLSLVDRNLELNGNDFGIDDITLTAIPEPATWALMLTGFGLVGVGLRRRTRAAA